METDPHRISQRLKQIEYGKNTIGYYKYSRAVSRDSRRRGLDPETPDARQACSKRSFDGQVRKWRRALHAWDDYEGDGRPEYPDGPRDAAEKQGEKPGERAGDAAPDASAAPDAQAQRQPFPEAPARGRGGLAGFLFGGFKRRRPEEAPKDGPLKAGPQDGAPRKAEAGGGSPTSPLAQLPATSRQRVPAAGSRHQIAGELEEFELVDEEEAGWTCVRAAARQGAAEAPAPRDRVRAA